jgi:hypothetical protein
MQCSARFLFELLTIRSNQWRVGLWLFDDSFFTTRTAAHYRLHLYKIVSANPFDSLCFFISALIIYFVYDFHNEWSDNPSGGSEHFRGSVQYVRLFGMWLSKRSHLQCVRICVVVFPLEEIGVFIWNFAHLTNSTILTNYIDLKPREPDNAELLSVNVLLSRIHVVLSLEAPISNNLLRLCGFRRANLSCRVTDNIWTMYEKSDEICKSDDLTIEEDLKGRNECGVNSMDSAGIHFHWDFGVPLDPPHKCVSRANG